MKKIIPYDATLIPDKAERVFEGIIYDVYQWQQEQFDGTFKTFEMLRRPDTTVVIGIVDSKIVVIEDEQPHRGLKLTFPGGRADIEGESSLAAAQREMLEETGYRFANWKLVKVYKPLTKMEWFIYIFVADTVIGQGRPHLDPGEKITVRLESYDDMKDLVLKKAGDMGEAEELFADKANLEEFLLLPEFKGREIER